MRNHKLHDFLKSSGVSKDTPEEVVEQLKLQYRKEYLAQWRKDRSKKEIRFSVTPKQFDAIEIMAVMHGYTSAIKYCKEAVLHSLTNAPHLPNREQLHLIFQKIGIAINSLSDGDNEVRYILTEAEYLLNSYLHLQHNDHKEFKQK